METQRDVHDAIAASTLEWKLTHPLAFGLSTASPLQRAICRVADGRPLGALAKEKAVENAIGAYVPGVKPKEVAFLSGIRVGKSLFAAALAVHGTQSCDVSRLGPGEVPRFSIVSLKKDLADVVFAHVVGRIKASVLLRELLLGEPSADTLTLRHPTGRPIEITVVAGSRAGSSLVARWSVGCVFDEFPRMVGASDGVVNWDDSRRSVLLRLLPGCQVVHIGSPWAPFGPAYNLVQERWLRPTRELVVIKAPAWDVNPSYWTEEVVNEAKKTDVNAYTTDVAGEFATQEDALFPGEQIEAATRAEGILPCVAGNEYRAAMDPATRGNGWTLVISTREGNKKKIAVAKEWRGTTMEPLSPRTVLSEISQLLHSYGIHVVESDQYYIDTLIGMGREMGITIVQSKLTETEKTARYLALRTKLAEGELEFPPEPLFKSDLKRLTRRVTQSGTTIHLPKTSDGRHCDYAPPVMLVLSSYLADAHQPSAPENPEVVRMRKQAQQRFGKSRGW